MTRYIALLRAINVGGHVVKMEHLRRLFEQLGCSNVETFIASGNVIFETASTASASHEEKIARHLGESLGFNVATFLRSDIELDRIARHRPFPAADLEKEGNGLYVGFLAAKPDSKARARLMKLATPEDKFHVHNREVFWMRRGGFSDSIYSGAFLEKTLGMPATFRNVTTVRKLAAKYRPA